MLMFETHSYKENWTDLPLHQILYEWIVKNISMPTDMSTIVAYIGLFLITWYAIVWVTRFIMTIIWPIFLIASAIIVFRILQFYEPEDIANITIQSVTIVADTLVRARFIYNYTLHQSVRIYKNIQDCIIMFYYILFGIDDTEEKVKDDNVPDMDMFVPEETFHIN